MKKQKLIDARLAKGMSQQEVADEINLNQSQYHRRENGEIPIKKKQWESIAKALGVKVEDIKDDDTFTNIYNYDNHSGNYSASNNYFYNIPDFVMKNQQKYIEMLENKVKDLTEALELSKT